MGTAHASQAGTAFEICVVSLDGAVENRTGHLWCPVVICTILLALPHPSLKGVKSRLSARVSDGR